jgi:DNA-binding XRE family transcriptional regulator
MPAPKGNKYAAGCEDSGRPTKYKEEYAEQVYKLCLLGATDKEMADIIGVSEQTFNAWKGKHKEFMESLTRGKDLADAEIAKSLYHRAKGYEHKETIVATYQGQITDTMDVIKHYPPDTPAATLWLKNRQPEKWRDKVEVDQKTDGSIEIVFNNQLDAWSK